QNSGDLPNSPTLTWGNSGLYLCWHNGNNIVESKSLDGGASWEMPVTLPFTGTNPRRLSDKNGGGSFYFFINNSGDAQVAISYDGGISFYGPFPIVTNIGAQQLDAEWAPDSSIVFSYSDAGIWKQLRSRDLGRTWA